MNPFVLSFNEKRDENQFQVEIWMNNKTLMLVFAILVLAHSIYLIILVLLTVPIITLYANIIIYGVYLPISVILLFASVMQPLRHKRLKIMWYIVLSIASIMVGCSILLRTLFCKYHIENPLSCNTTNRPTAQNVIIYATLGPLLFLVVMRNHIIYQTTAILIMLVLYVWVVIVEGNQNIATWFSLVFIIGSFLFATFVNYNRDKVERQVFLNNIKTTELTNKLKKENTEKEKLGRNLQNEIRDKNIAQKKAETAEANRNQFTSYIFHEIRVPLQNLVQSTNLLDYDEKLQQSLTDDSRDSFERIKQGLLSIKNIINDTLDFRKMNEGRLQITNKPFDYKNMINNVVWIMESSWKEKNIRFRKDFDPRLNNLKYSILGDENRLKQIVQNYLSNAVKFTFPEKSITLKTKLISSNDEIKPGDEFKIYTEVQDTGIGISENDMKKIFHPFIQINPDANQGGKGTGLGLSICAGIINSMNGTYGVRSKVGQGSSFWFEISTKLTNVERKKQISTRNSIDDNSENSVKDNIVLHILITDDNKSTRDIMTKICAKLNHKSDTAENGLDCLEKIQKAENENYPFDVLFIDNQMSIMSGKETITKLREMKNSITIISLTGSGEMEIQESLLEAGSNLILVKPASIQDIRNVLKEISFKKFHSSK